MTEKPEGNECDGLTKESTEKDACIENGSTRKERTNSVYEKLRPLSLTRKGLYVLGAIIALCLIFLIIIIVLAAHVGCSRRPISDDICQDAECFETAARVFGSLNRTVDPCVHMWNYSCGGWLASHPLPKSLGSLSVENEADKSFVETVRQILDTFPHTNVLHSAEWKLKAFYQSCMNLDEIETAGTRPLKRIIDTLRGWHVLGSWSPANWAWNTVLRELHVEHGVFPFFKYQVEPDPVLERDYIIQIAPSGLGLPDRSYYFRNPEDKVVRAYKRMVKDIAQLLGATSQAASALSEEVFYFERRIAEVYPTIHKSSAERITVRELQQLSQRVPWLEYLKSVFPNVVLMESSFVSVQSRQYLAEVSAILSTTDQRSLNSYLMWTLVHKYAAYLSSDCRLALEELRQALTGAIKEKERWEVCGEFTKDIFTSLVYSLYVQDNVPIEHLQAAAVVYQAIVDTFINTLNQLSWIEWDLKQNAAQRARQLTATLSMEDYTLNPRRAADFYNKFQVLKGYFFENMLNSVYFKRSLMESLLLNPATKYWELEDLTNRKAFLELSRNRLVLSPQLLVEPYFSSHLPAPMRFASLGVILARELLKGFEFFESFYKRQGHVIRPDEKTSVSIFRRQEECVYNLLSTLDVRGVDVNGNLTFRETIADIAGIATAFKALREWQRIHDLDARLPLLEKTEEEVFFLTYAQTLCKVTSEMSLETEASLSRWAPNYIRVNKILTKGPEFVKAFECKKKHNASPWEQCLVW